jgi:LDH2 family malate/lactate/ureidoglycolate dehydrogenase
MRIDAFVDPAAYAEAADAFGRSFLDAEARPNTTVRYPGWRAGRCERDRRRNGVPLDESVIRWLQDEYRNRVGSEAPSLEATPA